MCNLLYKEFRLTVHPTIYMFMLIGALLCVPAYPYCMVFLFGCLGLYFTTQFARENHDVFFTSTLPIMKRDVVKGRCLLFMAVEIGQMLISIPFSIARIWIIPEGNPVGIEANVAFYGFGFLIYAVYNFFFLTQFYKSAYKVGQSFIIAIIPAIIVGVAMEYLPRVAGMQWIDSIAIKNDSTIAYPCNWSNSLFFSNETYLCDCGKTFRKSRLVDR